MNIQTVLRNHKFQMSVVAASAAAAGAVVGYIYGQKSLLKSLDEAANQHTYHMAFDPEGTVTNLDDLKQLLAETEGVEIEVEEDEVDDIVEEPRVINIFVHGNLEWDQEAELAKRTADAPYIIHVDEFFGCEMGYDQTTLTYYEGDNILTDERDVPIYAWVEKVGELKFGHGTTDKSVVYIRNEKLQHEWEVLLSKESYETEVLGIQAEKAIEEDELRHSSNRRFRDE